VGINSNASVELDKLYAGYAAVSASNVPNFNVVDARITRTSFFNINNTIGRVGDIDVVGIDYTAWTGQGSGTSAFRLANAVASGARNWDFNVSGTQANEGLAVLNFNLGLDYSGPKPLLKTNVVVINYKRVAYVYAGLSQDELKLMNALARQFVPPPMPQMFMALPTIQPVLNVVANVISFSGGPAQSMRTVIVQPSAPSVNAAPASTSSSSSSNTEAATSSSSNATSDSSARSSSSTGTSAGGNRDGEGGEGGATNQTTPNAAPTGTTNEVVQ
jgi:hypothetical protein